MSSGNSELCKHLILLFFRELLGHLNSKQLDVLEQALCSSEGLGTLERNKLKAASTRKMAGALQNRTEDETRPAASSGSNIRRGASSMLTNPVSHLTSLSGSPRGFSSLPEEHHRRQSQDLHETSRRDVFEPCPVGEPDVVEIAVTMYNREEGGQLVAGAMALEDVEPFPRFGADRPIDNELPSSSSSSSSGVQQTQGTSQQQQHRNLSSSMPSFSSSSSSSSKNSDTTNMKGKGLAGFPSAEDLMHRLFLGISGVADQLQTNHAKDLRLILKTVFSVCQSDPLTSNDVIQSVADHSQSKCLGEAPCNSEPPSPLITPSDSKCGD